MLALALAATTLAGATTQDLPVRMTLSSAGVPQTLRIAWDAKCGRPGDRYRTFTRFDDDFDRRSATSLSDTGSYKPSGSGKETAVIRIRLRGRRVETGWRGTFSTRVVVRRQGELYDRCRLGTVRWSAGR